MRRTSFVNFTGQRGRERRRSAADRKAKNSREKARPRIRAIGLKSINSSI